MNVEELKEIIMDLPDDMEIICQRDPEGNGFSPLCGADSECFYHEGTVYETDSTADENCLDEDEWIEISEGPKSLVLWPVS